MIHIQTRLIVEVMLLSIHDITPPFLQDMSHVTQLAVPVSTAIPAADGPG